MHYAFYVSFDRLQERLSMIGPEEFMYTMTKEYIGPQNGVSVNVYLFTHAP